MYDYWFSTADFGDFFTRPLAVLGIQLPLFRDEKAPITHLFSAIYRGPITPWITFVGAHLVITNPGNCSYTWLTRLR